MALLSMNLQAKDRDGLPLQERIERGSMPVTECGCWIWMRCGSRLGYGMIKVGGKMISAHRASWVAHRGIIPSGAQVLHSCDIPSCVNPDHLALGTPKTNAAERKTRGRRRGDWAKTSSTVRSLPQKRTGFTPTERIERLSMPVTECGCWIFMGALRLGYGRLKNHRTGKSESAHRLSWEAYRGSIPKHLQVLHKCDVPSCVNPDHLFLGSHADNMADRKAKRRFASWCGSDHPGSKLDEKQVLAIRADVSADVAYLAVRFEVSPSTIRAIRAGRSWRHV